MVSAQLPIFQSGANKEKRVVLRTKLKKNNEFIPFDSDLILILRCLILLIIKLIFFLSNMSFLSTRKFPSKLFAFFLN
jgi:hypothetical protein